MMMMMIIIIIIMNVSENYTESGPVDSRNLYGRD